MEIKELKNIIINTKYIYNKLGTKFLIQLIEIKVNQIFKIYNSVDTIYAKVSRRGWSRYEWNSINSLYEKGYYVPKPIYYIPLITAILENWDFGNLIQENGIIFYYPIVGQSLLKNYSIDNLISVLNLLHNFHEENIKLTSDIENYQEYEVNRGVKYLNYLKMSENTNLLKKIKNYANLEIEYSLIHGDARPEHFIFSDKKIGMIDLEGLCIGDPFKDFGILLAELYFYGFQINLKNYSLIKKLFGRELTENEILRLKFFLIRRLLVKLKYDQIQKNKINIFSSIKTLCE